MSGKRHSTHRKNHKRSSNAKEYRGKCSTTWKERYGNHSEAFSNDDYENDTALSEEVWNIKRKDGQCTIQWQKHHSMAKAPFNGKSTIQWQKHQHFPSYTPEPIKCRLCMDEKLEIALHKGDDLLNKGSEISLQCRHRNRFKLIKLN